MSEKRDRQADKLAGIALMLKQQIELGLITKEQALDKIEKYI